MYIGLVTGTVVATIKHPFFTGKKLLIVQRLNPDQSGTAQYDIAVDDAQAGIGDTVLVLDEGTGARQILRAGTDAPVRAVIVGIIDDIQVTIPIFPL